MPIEATQGHSVFDEDEKRTASPLRVRRFCRIYATVVVILQSALITMLIARGTNFSLLFGIMFGLTWLGAALIAIGHPIGRSVFVPAAILQGTVAGLLGVFSLFGILAAYLSQSGPMALDLAIYAGLCVLSVLYLGYGIVLFTTSLKN